MVIVMVVLVYGDIYGDIYGDGGDLGEVVDAGELEDGGHAVEEGADDEPVQGRGVVHLGGDELLQLLDPFKSCILFKPVCKSPQRKVWSTALIRQFHLEP